VLILIGYMNYVGGVGTGGIINIRCFPYYSQQVFSRNPAILPCDSPIFPCVRSGDIDRMRVLLTSGTTTIDAVDPYGFGLLYVSPFL